MKKVTQNLEKVQHLNLNISKDDNNLNDFIFAWQEFGTRPNRITLYNSYSSTDFNSFILKKSISKNIFTEVIASDDENIINDKMFVQLEAGIFISYVVIDRNFENSRINEISFFYKTEADSKKVGTLIDQLNKFVIGYESEDAGDFRLNTVSISAGGLEIEPISFKEDLGEMDTWYSDSTLKGVTKFIKSIKKSEKGISVFWGDRGTGKTHILHHLAGKLDRMFIYIPNNMVDLTINNPDFRKFIKKYPKSIVVIDDCEVLTNEPFGRSNQFVGNLTQLVDDLSSDDLQLNIITIFNCQKETEIDEMILDVNNLVEVVHFTELSNEEADEVSSHLGFKKKWQKSVRLIDVVHNRTDLQKQELGF